MSKGQGGTSQGKSFLGKATEKLTDENKANIAAVNQIGELLDTIQESKGNETALNDALTSLNNFVQAEATSQSAIISAIGFFRTHKSFKDLKAAVQSRPDIKEIDAKTGYNFDSSSDSDKDKGNGYDSSSSGTLSDIPLPKPEEKPETKPFDLSFSGRGGGATSAQGASAAGKAAKKAPTPASGFDLGLRGVKKAPPHPPSTQVYSSTQDKGKGKGQPEIPPKR